MKIRTSNLPQRIINPIGSNNGTMALFTCTLLAFLLFTFTDQSIAEGIDGTLWKVTLQTEQMGPVETLVSFKVSGDKISGHSHSGALDILRNLPNLKSHGTKLERGLFTVELTPQGDHYEGPVTSPWKDGQITLTAASNEISGSINGGIFSGSFTGVPTDSTGPLRDYLALLKAFDGVVAQKLFNPNDLKEKPYVKFRKTLETIAESARDDLDLLFGFRFAWTGETFSHFQLRRFPAPAEAIIASFDEMRVGYDAARLEFDDNIAVLRVDTMMGNDTIEQINAAYKKIAENRPKALIIDLRGNGGGAFAVKPLVEHIISEPLSAGYFISQKWTANHALPPTPEELAPIGFWHGWSIIEFWRSVQEQPLLRIRFEPAEPHFAGPVFVLIDSRSASATEMAIDALRSSGRVTLVGKPTAGEMLSQSFFDVAEGFVVVLPVADYYSVKHGRIEGVGVPVDVSVAPEKALEKAKILIKERH